ncbi:MAG: hypothetical protein H7X80_09195, partial [bacterium]|nr:hypothetical protein [Candidatus Kapabacteria bacterium]
LKALASEESIRRIDSYSPWKHVDDGTAISAGEHWMWVRPSPIDKTPRREGEVVLSVIVQKSDAATTSLAIALDSVGRVGTKFSPTLQQQAKNWIPVSRIADGRITCIGLLYDNGKLAGSVTYFAYEHSPTTYGVYVIVADTLDETISPNNLNPRGLDFYRLMVTGPGIVKVRRIAGDSVAESTLAEGPDDGYLPWDEKFTGPPASPDVN